MNGLIIGFGEVGKALYEVLKEYHDITIIDRNNQNTQIENVEIMHITFPYSNEFEKEVSKYQQLYNPRYTVIHSTTPVGTCRKLNSLHSPVRGKHPYLSKSLLTFEKMLGGENSDEVADYFRRAGIKILLFRKQETSELAKLLDTLYYGVCIEFAKEVERLCNKHKVPFSEVYVLSNMSYNEGYERLNCPEFIRPVLLPLQKKIGGHCVLENTELVDSLFAEFIKKLNSSEK